MKILTAEIVEVSHRNEDTHTRKADIHTPGHTPTCFPRYSIDPHKSQPRTGHTREPDSTHNELKHTTTRKTATHERTPDKPHVHTHTHTSRSENDANQQTTPPRIAATLPQPPPRASALARGTIAYIESSILPIQSVTGCKCARYST